MTPIAEKTESSLGVPTVREKKEDYFDSTTPSKATGSNKLPVRPINDEFGSSPFREIINEARPIDKIAQPLLGKNLKSKKSAPLATKVQASGGALCKRNCDKGTYYQRRSM